MNRSKKLASSWDRNARNWTRAVREGEIPSRRAGADEAIIQAILDRRPQSLLDVGCGEGWLIRAVRDRLDCAAVGIDGSAALIDEARKADPDGEYHLLSYAELSVGGPALDGPFDAVVFNYAILDEDATSPLSAAKALLAPGGSILIQTLHPHRQDGPYRDGWRTEDFAAFNSDGWQPMPWYFRTLESWQGSIRMAGLTLSQLVEPTATVDSGPLSLILVCVIG